MSYTATTETYTLSYTTLFRSETATGQPPDRPPHRLRAGTTGAAARRCSGCWPSAARCAARPASRLRAVAAGRLAGRARSEEHTSELQSRVDLVCRLLLEKKK